MDKATFIARLREHIASQRASRRELLGQATGAAEPVDFGEDDDLFSSGILDSFALTELVMFVEETTGREISIEQMSRERFATMGAIFRAFVQS